MLSENKIILLVIESETASNFMKFSTITKQVMLNKTTILLF